MELSPRSIYSMRQAIEEGCILDTLTHYQAYWRLSKKIKDDPRYDRVQAEYLLKLFVDSFVLPETRNGFRTERKGAVTTPNMQRRERFVPGVCSLCYGKQVA